MATLQKLSSVSNLQGVLVPDVRQVKLYFMAVFHKGQESNPVISCFNSTDELLDVWCKYRVQLPHVYVHTFTEYIYVYKGHPLFDHAEPVKSTNRVLRIHR